MDKETESIKHLGTEAVKKEDKLMLKTPKDRWIGSVDKKGNVKHNEINERNAAVDLAQSLGINYKKDDDKYDEKFDKCAKAIARMVDRCGEVIKQNPKDDFGQDDAVPDFILNGNIKPGTEIIAVPDGEKPKHTGIVFSELTERLLQLNCNNQNKGK